MNRRTRPAARVIARVELVNAMSMVPIPGRVKSGRSTILWISNWCIGSAMPPRSPSIVFTVVGAEILGRTPFPGGFRAHRLGGPQGQPNRDDEAHQDPNDRSPRLRPGDRIDRKAEPHPHEPPAQKQAQQAIAVAMRLSTVV